MEYWKSIIELISSISILIAAIIGANAFKYKHDSSIRDLYVENCQKIREVLGYVFAKGNINDEMQNQAKCAYQEASIYLHSDIVDFTKTIFDLLCDLEMYVDELEDLPVGPERSKIAKLKRDVTKQLYELNKKSMNVYRQHIVQDSIFKKIGEWLKTQLNQSYIINSFKKITTKANGSKMLK